ncbi:MAG: carboxypeptidase-like regulatory domain-containing protein, partial [Oscillospiraceae bacterium]|nr:carboxypeptidase-like regulatory domain-containing protein [Oscillospiraceae bacterium]
MKNNFYSKLFLIILFVISGFTGFAQQATVTGTVFDERNAPLAYASVEVKGTTIGSVTDINGRFAITVPFGERTIVFSFLGYQTKSVPATIVEGKPVELNASLEPLAIQGREVVITAQVRGQAQAINQQLNAPGIVNVVS